MHPMLFAGTSSVWGGKGKAFLDDTTEGHSYGRVYEIISEQYAEVKRNEGGDYTIRKRLSRGCLKEFR